MGCELAVAEIGVPDGVDRLGQLLTQQRPSALRVRAIILERKVELQDFGRERLDSEILPVIDAVGGPNQKAEDERREQGQEPDHRADHVTRPAGREFVRQQTLEDETDCAAGEDRERDQARKLLRRLHSRLRQPARAFGYRRGLVNGARSAARCGRSRTTANGSGLFLSRRSLHDLRAWRMSSTASKLDRPEVTALASSRRTCRSVRRTRTRRWSGDRRRASSWRYNVC